MALGWRTALCRLAVGMPSDRLAESADLQVATFAASSTCAPIIARFDDGEAIPK